jgi:LacI family transcriptional regulator
MGSLLDLDRPPSAVFVASDVVAFGALAAIRERGFRAPDQIALVGFDDVPLSRYVDPPLTTVHLPAERLARRSSEMLIKLIQRGGSSPSQVLLDTHLVVRESCGIGSSN